MQGGGKEIGADVSVVETGGTITLNGPPGEAVFYKPDGVAGGGKTVVLGPDGKATVTAPLTTCTLTILLVSDPLKFVTVEVINLLNKPLFPGMP